MKDLTVIIPLHKFNEEIENYLNNAINSIIEQKSKPDFVKIIFSNTNIIQLNNFIEKYKKDINIDVIHNDGLSNFGVNKTDTKWFSKLEFDDVYAPIWSDNVSKDINIDVIHNDGLSNFASQINFGVNKIDTKWFSILEFDDVYTPIWFDNVSKYIESKTDVSVFIPINNIYDAVSGNFISFSNEVIWANAFSNELGYIDNDCLKVYFDFQVDGAVFNTQDFIDVGMLKPSIKLSFWYEYLLRATNNGQFIYVIPKIGYHHLIGRDDSLMKHYSQELTPEEGAWWIDLAKKEYNFLEDRKIEYTKN